MSFSLDSAVGLFLPCKCSRCPQDLEENTHIRCLILKCLFPLLEATLGHIKGGTSASSWDNKQPALGLVCFYCSVMPSTLYPS